jgi:hypothetical protein
VCARVCVCVWGGRGGVWLGARLRGRAHPHRHRRRCQQPHARMHTCSRACAQSAHQRGVCAAHLARLCGLPLVLVHLLLADVAQVVQQPAHECGLAGIHVPHHNQVQAAPPATRTGRFGRQRRVDVPARVCVCGAGLTQDQCPDATPSRACNPKPVLQCPTHVCRSRSMT